MGPRSQQVVKILFSIAVHCIASQGWKADSPRQLQRSWSWPQEGLTTRYFLIISLFQRQRRRRANLTSSYLPRYFCQYTTAAIAAEDPYPRTFSRIVWNFALWGIVQRYSKNCCMRDEICPQAPRCKIKWVVGATVFPSRSVPDPRPERDATAWSSNTSGLTT